MEQPESNEPRETVSASGNDVPVPVASPARPTLSSPAPCRVLRAGFQRNLIHLAIT
jgi:hypothetical protein